MGTRRRRWSRADWADELLDLSERSKRKISAASKELGRQIAEDRDAKAVNALVGLLCEPELSTTAANVLAVCGEEAPGLLVPHAARFLELLKRDTEFCSRTAMQALSWVSRAAPDVLWPRRGELLTAFDEGSARTREAAVAILTTLASSSPSRRNHLSPMLLELLRGCGRKSLPRWAEKVMPALTGRGRAEAAKVLRQRMDELDTRARNRVEKLLT